MNTHDRHSLYRQQGLLTQERLGLFLTNAASYWPERRMINFDGVWYTYQDILRWTTSTAHRLLASGVKPGHRVLLQATNSVEFLTLQFAVWRIGAISVPVVPIYRKHELLTIVGDVKPQVVATNQKIGSRNCCVEMDEVLAECGVKPLAKLLIGAGEAGNGWVRMPPPSDDGETISDAGLPESAEPHECSVILFTSGTTSAPKGAMLNGQSIVGNGHAMRRVLGISENDVALCATPLAHTSAFLVSVVLPMAAGGRVVVLPAWKPDQAVELIEREAVTFMGAPPLILHDLVERYERDTRPGHRIRKFYCGGGTVTPSLIKRAETVGIKASRNFGMTETTGACAMSHADAPLERRAHFDARPFFGTELEIVDPDRRPLPCGEVGEIRIRSPQLMIGYTDPKITAAQIDAEGWFYTGDLGTLDAEGWLSVAGRLKDIINRGGEKFSTLDIETAITNFPDVEDAAVVGAPDKRFGEVVAAFIRLKPGAVWQGPDAICKHLEAVRLAKQKMPVQWHVVDELPRTASGKVQKQKLRDRLWKEEGSSA